MPDDILSFDQITEILNKEMGAGDATNEELLSIRSSHEALRGRSELAEERFELSESKRADAESELASARRLLDEFDKIWSKFGDPRPLTKFHEKVKRALGQEDGEKA